MTLIVMPTSGYTKSDGIEPNNVTLFDYVGELESTGEVFDTADEAQLTVSEDKLIEGFYEGVLGMKVGENKRIVVPPEKGYTTESHELYGETLIFEVRLEEVISGTTVASSSATPDNLDSTSLSLPFDLITLTFVSFLLMITLYRASDSST